MVEHKIDIPFDGDIADDCRHPFVDDLLCLEGGLLHLTSDFLELPLSEVNFLSELAVFFPKRVRCQNRTPPPQSLIFLPKRFFSGPKPLLHVFPVGLDSLACRHSGICLLRNTDEVDETEPGCCSHILLGESRMCLDQQDQTQAGHKYERPVLGAKRSCRVCHQNLVPKLKKTFWVRSSRS